MASKHPITCHILDTTRGRPAQNVKCTLFQLSDFSGGSDETTITTQQDEPLELGSALTDGDGRIARWTLSSSSSSSSSDLAVVPGIYKIKFETAEYFKQLGKTASSASGSTTTSPAGERTFFPYVEIMFIVENPPDSHYHIPLLLSNYSYSTYRGS